MQALGFRVQGARFIAHDLGCWYCSILFVRSLLFRILLLIHVNVYGCISSLCQVMRDLLGQPESSSSLPSPSFYSSSAPPPSSSFSSSLPSSSPRLFPPPPRRPAPPPPSFLHPDPSSSSPLVSEAKRQKCSITPFAGSLEP